MNWRLGGVIAFALLAGCSQPALIKQTASGNPEAVFKGISMDQARNEFVLACLKSGGESTTDAYSVTCSKRNEGMRGMLAQALLGNGFSQTPWEKIRFSFAEVPGGVFVTVAGWMEMTMGFGEIKRVPYTNNAFRNTAQGALDTVASRLEQQHPDVRLLTAPASSETGTSSPSPTQQPVTATDGCKACSRISEAYKPR